LLNKRSGPLLEADSNPSDDNSQQLVSNIRPSSHGEVRFQLQRVRFDKSDTLPRTVSVAQVCPRARRRVWAYLV